MITVELTFLVCVIIMAYQYNTCIVPVSYQYHTCNITRIITSFMSYICVCVRACVRACACVRVRVRVIYYMIHELLDTFPSLRFTVGWPLKSCAHTVLC